MMGSSRWCVSILGNWLLMCSFSSEVKLMVLNSRVVMMKVRVLFRCMEC